MLGKDTRNQETTLSHGEIADLMPAMTMDYKLRDSGALLELEPGDKIKADLFVQNGGIDYWLEHIEIADRSRRGAVLDGPAHQLEIGEPIPDLAMLDQDSKPIRLGQLRGKAVLITFIYTRCPLPTFCPRITSQFAAIHDRLGKYPDDARRTHPLSISFDPEYDKPEICASTGWRASMIHPYLRPGVSHRQTHKISGPCGPSRVRLLFHVPALLYGSKRQIQNCMETRL